MSERAKVCTATGQPLNEPNATSFPCPECGIHIGRSGLIRNQGVAYVCNECGFQGP